MIFLHCFECRLEVTPSRRCVVLRMGNHVSLAPTTEERLEALCASSQAARVNFERAFPTDGL